MEDVHNLINIGPTNTIQILNQHEIFLRFCMCPSNDTFDKNKKNLEVGTGAQHGWLVIEVEQLFTVLEQWRTAAPKINWALSRLNHTKCYPSMWLIFVIISDILSLLTQWGRVTHISVSKLTIIGSVNGLSPDRRQAIIWTNAGLLLIQPSGTNFNEILISKF